jgi:tetratricopeptide (TPR) repeat protein
MRRLLFILFCCCTVTCFSQINTQRKKVFFVDSARIDFNTTDFILEPSDIASIAIFTQPDTLQMLKCTPNDSVIFIITKAFVNRPDSLRKIPSAEKATNTKDTLNLYTGPFINYYTNGNIKFKGHVIKGIIEGNLLVYYPTGELMESSYYYRGTADGPHEEFYMNGELKSSGQYYSGVKTNIWREWYSTGKLKDEYLYENGDKHFREASDEEVEILIQQAIEKIDNTKYNDGIRLLKTAARLKPDYAVIYLYRGIAYNKTAKYNDAIADLNKYISIEPSNAEAYVQRAFAHMQQNSQQQNLQVDADVICQDFEKAVALGDRSISVRNSMKALCK